MKYLVLILMTGSFISVQAGILPDGNPIRKAAADTTIPVIWADWISGTTGTSGTASGKFSSADGDIGITYTGEVAFLQTGTGTNYFNPSAPYLSSSVINAPPASEMIGLSHATSKTLTFSKPVDHLFFAVVSLNSNGYRFNRDFEIVSTGTGYWGSGTLTRVVNGDGTFQLNGTGEPHGVIRFVDTLSSITWTSLTNEYWNGFTIGTYGVATVPVEMTAFSGSVSNGMLTRAWSTASELHNFGWSVQKRSQIQTSWQPLGFVAGKGTTTEAQSYSFSAPVSGPENPVEIRLIQRDLDGTETETGRLVLTAENPEQMTVSEAWPNPFNPETRIRIQVPAETTVRYEIISLTGDVIFSAGSELLSAGSHSLLWNGRSSAGNSAASGTYFCRIYLKTQGKSPVTKIRRMVLVK